MRIVLFHEWLMSLGPPLLRSSPTRVYLHQRRRRSGRGDNAFRPTCPMGLTQAGFYGEPRRLKRAHRRRDTSQVAKFSRVRKYVSGNNFLFLENRQEKSLY